MDIFAAIGYLLICWFYPLQIYRVWTRKSVEDLSILSLWSLFTGAVLLEYSMVFFGGYPLYQWGNGFAAVCAGILLLQYYYYKRDELVKPHRPPLRR